jgi:hypothetical protein
MAPSPQHYYFRNNSGSLAKLTASRRASSCVCRLSPRQFHWSAWQFAVAVKARRAASEGASSI